MWVLKWNANNNYIFLVRLIGAQGLLLVLNPEIDPGGFWENHMGCTESKLSWLCEKYVSYPLYSGPINDTFCGIQVPKFLFPIYIKRSYSSEVILLVTEKKKAVCCIVKYTLFMSWVNAVTHRPEKYNSGRNTIWYPKSC